ncbi:hypothetical protein WJX72_011248 [[Myrmecia] bisecta]|uniref:Uncharacterized protein n=1 Tax=[Myrmecia] bisecta TaxID=41462 RepID=A0AAW1P8D9_9CHLO
MLPELDWGFSGLCEPIGNDLLHTQGTSPPQFGLQLGSPFDVDHDFTRLAESCQLLGWDAAADDMSLLMGSPLQPLSRAESACLSQAHGAAASQAPHMQSVEAFCLAPPVPQPLIYPSHSCQTQQHSGRDTACCTTGPQGTPASSDTTKSAATALPTKRPCRNRKAPAAADMISKPAKRSKATSENDCLSTDSASTGQTGVKRTRQQGKVSNLEVPSSDPSSKLSEFWTTPLHERQLLQRTAATKLMPFSVIKTSASSLADLNARIQASAARAPAPLKYLASPSGSCDSGTSTTSAAGADLSFGACGSGGVGTPGLDGSQPMMPLRPLPAATTGASRFKTSGVTITPMAPGPALA